MSLFNLIYSIWILKRVTDDRLDDSVMIDLVVRRRLAWLAHLELLI